MRVDKQFSDELSAFAYKIECEFLVGLSAKDPAVRARFLALYDSRTTRTLNERLSFIIKGHSWEYSSHTFWLKRALDLLLTLLKANEHITLAPNSAQVRATPLAPTSTPNSAQVGRAAQNWKC